MTANALNKTVIRFGADAQWTLPGQLPQLNALPAVTDIEATVFEALQSPLGLASIDQMMVPDDVVALAVDPACPQLPAVSAAVIHWLCQSGTELSNIRLVLGSPSPSLRQEVEQGLHARGLATEDAMGLQVISHDADDPQAVAYLAANQESMPIYINRSLVDADVVIPIACARRQGSWDYLGSYSTFPLFSDRATRGRMLSLPRLEHASEHAQLKSWADEAAWWLGLLAGIQILPAAQGQVAAVQAGLLEPLEDAMQLELSRIRSEQPLECDLVIALLDGSDAQQTWQAVARALRHATRYVAPRGAIALCTQLSEPAGKGLRRLSDAHHTREEIAAKLSKDDANDALPASVILEATGDYHVYLASNLRRDVVENLGIAVLENESQLAHLVGQVASCSVLCAAQYLD